MQGRLRLKWAINVRGRGRGRGRGRDSEYVGKIYNV